MEQDLTQIAVIILWNYYSGWDDLYVYCATDAVIMIDIVCEVNLDKN